MVKSLFAKSCNRRSLAVVVCLAMLLSMFLTMSAVASTTIISPTVLTADKWSADSRLSISAVDNGVLKVSNAVTYDSAIWPNASVEVTVDLDKVPYFYYEISQTNTPLTIYLLQGETRVDLQGNNWGGATGVQKQIVSISERLGVTGVQTFHVVFQWLSGDVFATEVGQRNVIFSQLGVTDGAGKAAFEGTLVYTPTELTPDKWGADSRLSVSAVDNGVLKVSNAVTYDSAIWPEAEAEVTVDLDKVPYFYYEISQTNTPYSIYFKYNGVKTYIQGNQYGGVADKTSGIYSVKDTLNLSGVQTFSVGIHWLNGDVFATEVGQRNIVFSRLGLTDEAGKAVLEGTVVDTPTVLTADKWSADSRLSISAVDNGVLKVSNAVTYDSAIWPNASVEITVDLDKVPYFYYEISQTNTPLTIYLLQGETRVDLQGNNWGGATGVQKQIVSISERLGVTGIQTFHVVFQWLSGDAFATEVGQRNVIFSQLGVTDEAGKAAFEATLLDTPTALTADKWTYDSRLSISAVDNGVIKVSNAATYDSAIWPEAEAEVKADLDKVPYFYYEISQTNTPYSIYFKYNDVKTYIQGNQYGGVPGKTSGIFSVKDTLNLSGVQTFSVGIHWLSGDVFATEVGQRNIIFSSLGLTDEAGKADFDSRNTITSATRIPIDGFAWDSSRITVDITDDGYGFATAIPGTAAVAYAEITKEIAVDLDKVPYLYVDVADAEVEWKVKFSANGTVYSGDPGLSENNLPYGAAGLHRFNMARATGLTGVQTIGIMIYTVDSDYQMTAGSKNVIDGLYVDGEEFSFDAPEAIDDTTILDPADFRYIKSMLDLQTNGSSYTMAIIPPSYPSWQTANMGLTIDFDKIRYLCLNIPECTGDIEITVYDIENAERYTLAREKKEFKGTLLIDLDQKLGFSGVKTIVLGVTYTDGTYKKMATVDNMYLTTADFKIPDGIENLTDVTPGNNENPDNNSSQGQETPDTGVTDSILPILIPVMAAAIVLIGKRRKARN